MNKKTYLLCICLLSICLCACQRNVSKTESEPRETEQTAEQGDKWKEAYHNLILKENVKRAALIYLDEDAIPEMVVLKNGEYRLYSFDGLQITAIDMPDGGIKANAYGFKHDFENYPEGLTFYWFEYVPYQGLIRVHGGDDGKRCDYYLNYKNDSLVLELEAKSNSAIWQTYNAQQEIANEEFLSKLSDLGYDKLIPCGYLYENIADAYENIGRTSNNREMLDDFVSGKIDALYYVEEIFDIPEEGFAMKSYENFYNDIVIEDAIGSREYVDFDNDGEEELVICSNTGACAFFDVIGNTVYKVVETHSTADIAYVAEMEGKRVIARSDLVQGTKGGRKRYIVMQYDSCGCLVDFFRLFAFYEGTSYSAEDEFTYRGQDITMEEFEEIKSSIQRISSEMCMKHVGTPEEFYTFQGKWIVGEYLDGAVESTGVDINTEEYKGMHEKWILEMREKYEGYSFEISEDSMVYFLASSEIGYHFDDYAELFFVFRQPSTLGIVPPFVCASVQLKGLDEEFDIIIDGNGDAVLEVENGFFELNREN